MYIVQCITKDKDDILKELCKKKKKHNERKYKST
jgi:hypothetical protein